jgi:hypothetical protein
MRLVKVFYESLPYLCFVAGVATLGYFRDFPGSFLGLVLVFISGWLKRTPRTVGNSPILGVSSTTMAVLVCAYIFMEGF